MAAPSHSSRTTVANAFYLKEGFKTTLAISGAPSILFWEKKIKPSGRDGGEPIPNTTQFNVKYETARSRSLIKRGPISMRVAYDPDVFPTIDAQINVEQSFTQALPDGSSEDFWGYLQKFEPAELVIGEAPEADVMLVVTNWDPVNGVEAGPVFNSGSG